MILFKSITKLKQGPVDLAPHISESTYWVITQQCTMLNADH